MACRSQPRVTTRGRFLAATGGLGIRHGTTCRCDCRIKRVVRSSPETEEYDQTRSNNCVGSTPVWMMVLETMAISRGMTCGLCCSTKSTTREVLSLPEFSMAYFDSGISLKMVSDLCRNIAHGWTTSIPHAPCLNRSKLLLGGPNVETARTKSLRH